MHLKFQWLVLDRYLVILLKAMENHEDWPLPSPLSFLLIIKKFYFVISFSFILLGILFPMLCCFSN